MDSRNIVRSRTPDSRRLPENFYACSSLHQADGVKSHMVDVNTAYPDIQSQRCDGDLTLLAYSA